jgi:hypothetical protein
MKSTDVAKEFQQTGDDPRQYRLEVGLWASSRAVSPTATVVTLPSPAYCLGLRKSTKTFTIICEADQRSFYQHTPSILCWKSETGLNMVASKILPEAYHGLRSSGAFVPPSPGPMYACYNLRHHRMPPLGSITFHCCYRDNPQRSLYPIAQTSRLMTLQALDARCCFQPVVV